jgi:hypothetical protein
MANVKLTINGTVEFDGDPGEWKDTPPDVFRDVLKPGAPLRPWLNHAAMAMAYALQADQSVDIEVEHRSNRFTLKVVDAS